MKKPLFAVCALGIILSGAGSADVPQDVGAVRAEWARIK